MEDFSWLSGEIHRRNRVFKNNQEKLLHYLSEEVTRTPAVFEQVGEKRFLAEQAILSIFYAIFGPRSRRKGLSELVCRGAEESGCP